MLAVILALANYFTLSPVKIVIGRCSNDVYPKSKHLRSETSLKYLILRSPRWLGLAQLRVMAADSCMLF